MNTDAEEISSRSRGSAWSLIESDFFAVARMEGYPDPICVHRCLSVVPDLFGTPFLAFGFSAPAWRAEQARGPAEDSAQHGPRQSARECILLARVVRRQQQGRRIEAAEQPGPKTRPRRPHPAAARRP